MADKKISELTAATTMGDTDVLPIVQGSATKKIALANFKTNLNLDNIASLTVTDTLNVEGATTLNSVNVISTSSMAAINATSVSATSCTINTINSDVGNLASLNLSSVQNVSAADDVIDVTKSITLCTNVEVTPYDVTLGIAAQPGHLHMILFDAITITLLCSAGSGWSQIAPESVGSSALLLYVGPSWYILSSRNVTVT